METGSEVLKWIKKKGVHLALDDINRINDEMKFYRENVFQDFRRLQVYFTIIA